MEHIFLKKIFLSIFITKDLMELIITALQKSPKKIGGKIFNDFFIDIGSTI